MGGASRSGRWRLSRRELLAAGAVAGIGRVGTAVAAESVVVATDFAALAPGPSWGPGWACPGVANLLVADGLGLLEAGSDVFPDDPRPVAFAVDARVLDGRVRAVVARAGSMAGVVLRRVGPRDYYAALLDAEQGELLLVRRSGSDLVTLASAPVPLAAGEIGLELSARGARPTALEASLLGADGAVLASATARDAHPGLQQPGDPGVLSRARTLFPSAGPPVLPALGNLHLLPYGVQEGQVVVESPAGQAMVGEIRRRSTVALRSVTVWSAEAPRVTMPSVIAATTGLPRDGGARLHVATDLPAEVQVEVSASASFARPRRLAAVATRAYEAASVPVAGLAPGSVAFWRATVRRRGVRAAGPVRSFAVAGGAGEATLAIASCGTQFGAIFDHLAALRPDVFVWQGDLNYPDTHGPVAQTPTGYAGIWRDFLANPRLAPVLERAAFVTQRDDHDYGLQDARAATIPQAPWGLEPWDALLGDETGARFSAGPADVWVLDQRRFKSDPAEPDSPAKTLLGARQREWLLDGLATSSAPFKVICSPCTLFMPANARDGNWATGFVAERDLLLARIAERVSGRVVFVTGDTHLTGVFDEGGRYEVRAAPIDIPVPNDITLSDPFAGERLRRTAGVRYADEMGHVAVLRGTAAGPDRAQLEVSLLRQDGAVPYRRTFEEPVPAPVVRVAVDDVAGARRRGRVRLRVRVDGPGSVRVRAVVERLRGPRRQRTRLASRVLDVGRAGSRRVTLRIGARGRSALGRRGRLRLRVSARFDARTGRSAVARARRWLRR